MPGEDGVARCPTCSAVDPTAARLPLFVLTGASASGKSTVYPLLLENLRGRCAVFDADWLIDPLGGASAIDWDAFRDTWLHIAHGLAQNGLPTLLLGPFIPEHLDALPGRRWVSDVHFAVLDCAAETRAARIQARPRWRSRDIDEQQAFADWQRGHLSPVFDTATASPQQTARAVTEWVNLAIGGSAVSKTDDNDS